MKKIAKISLVAAVAVAGLTTANAQPLEQAIKGVEVSGSVVYRYNDFNNDTNYSVEGKKRATNSDKGGYKVNSDGSKTDTDNNNTEGQAYNGESTKNNGTDSFSDNNYKVGLNVASQVNDFVKEKSLNFY